MNLPQSLHPRVVDDLGFGHFCRRQSVGRNERNIAVQRIVAQALALKVSHAGDYRFQRSNGKGWHGVVLDTGVCGFEHKTHDLLYAVRLIETIAVVAGYVLRAVLASGRCRWFWREFPPLFTGVRS